MTFEIFKASASETIADRLTVLAATATINFVITMHNKQEYLIAYT